jgi:hypothetical protein
MFLGEGEELAFFKAPEVLPYGQPGVCAGLSSNILIGPNTNKKSPLKTLIGGEGP